MDSSDEGFADASDVGSDVWALMPTESTSICTACGAPDHLCQHTDSWQLFDVPLLMQGKLLSFVASVERAEPDCRVEGAGMDKPVHVFRTEKAAAEWRRKQHAFEFGLLASWAEGRSVKLA